MLDAEDREEELDAIPHHERNHVRSTYTREEASIVRELRGMRLINVLWLSYLLPSVLALVIGLFGDGSSYSDCDIYILIWAYVQIAIQTSQIIVKCFSLAFLYYIPFSPEPEAVLEIKENRFFAFISGLNRILFLAYTAWLSVGILWISEVLFADSYCHRGLLYDICLTLIILHFLCLVCFGAITCLSCIWILGRVIYVVFVLARRNEGGFSGLFESNGADKDTIQQYTTTKEFTPGMIEEDCALCSICLEDYEEGDEIRFLPCTDLHHFHSQCVDQWLGQNKCCPLCKGNIDKSPEDSEQASEEDLLLHEEEETLRIANEEEAIL